MASGSGVLDPNTCLPYRALCGIVDLGTSMMVPPRSVGGTVETARWLSGALGSAVEPGSCSRCPGRESRLTAAEVGVFRALCSLGAWDLAHVQGTWGPALVQEDEEMSLESILDQRHRLVSLNRRRRNQHQVRDKNQNS